ncbi:hypothetical protein T01_15292, partial [Trichinella spiralis]
LKVPRLFGTFKVEHHLLETFKVERLFETFKV